MADPAPAFHDVSSAPIRNPTVVSFASDMHEKVEESATSILARSENLVVEYVTTHRLATIEFDERLHEHAIIVPDSEVELRLSLDGRSHLVPSRSVTFVPPGRGAIEVQSPAIFLRIMTVDSDPARATRAENASAYFAPDVHMGSFEPWPMPVGPPIVRTYPIPTGLSGSAGSGGWIARCTTHMICWSFGHKGDEVITGDGRYQRVGPHSHSDYEQIEVVLSSPLRFFLRVPWTLDRGNWLPDQDFVLQAPGFLAIPPRVEHMAVSESEELVESLAIWSPPRSDWATVSGRVLNERDYPLHR